MMQHMSPSLKFILPTAYATLLSLANTCRPNRPVTLNAGMLMPAWYDIKGLSGDRLSEDFEGLLETKNESMA
jgi:hypothetical protein